MRLSAHILVSYSAVECSLLRQVLLQVLLSTLVDVLCVEHTYTSYLFQSLCQQLVLTAAVGVHLLLFYE